MRAWQRVTQVGMSEAVDNEEVLLQSPAWPAAWPSVDRLARYSSPMNILSSLVPLSSYINLAKDVAATFRVADPISLSHAIEVPDTSFIEGL